MTIEGLDKTVRRTISIININNKYKIKLSSSLDIFIANVDNLTDAIVMVKRSIEDNTFYKILKQINYENRKQFFSKSRN